MHWQLETLASVAAAHTTEQLEASAEPSTPAVSETTSLSVSEEPNNANSASNNGTPSASQQTPRAEGSSSAQLNEAGEGRGIEGEGEGEGDEGGEVDEPEPEREMGESDGEQEVEEGEVEAPTEPEDTDASSKPTPRPREETLLESAFELLDIHVDEVFMKGGATEKEKENGQQPPSVPATPTSSASSSSTPAPSGKSTTMKGATKGQERNIHALNVLKRIKAKLEGKIERAGGSDDAAEKKLSVPQQVLEHIFPEQSSYFRSIGVLCCQGSYQCGPLVCAVRRMDIMGLDNKARFSDIFTPSRCVPAPIPARGNLW